MSTNDYIKFLTQQFVRYYDVPKGERRERREQRKEEKPSFSYRWFGILPFAMKMLFRRNTR